MKLIIYPKKNPTVFIVLYSKLSYLCLKLKKKNNFDDNTEYFGIVHFEFDHKSHYFDKTSDLFTTI